MKNFKVKEGPFIHSKDSTNQIIKRLMFSLLPIIICFLYKYRMNDYLEGKASVIELIYPLLFIVVPTLTCYIVELLYVRLIRKKKNEELKDYMNNSYSWIPGLFLALIMPLKTPLILLIIGAIITTIIKQLYGGFGHNIFNPALIGKLCIIMILIINNNRFQVNAYELLNEKTIGETSILLYIVAFIYLTYTKVIKWKIPVFYIGTVFVMTLLIKISKENDIINLLLQTLSEGLIFSAIFIATDPVTSPVTSFGQIIYGSLLGIITVLCFYLVPQQEGILISILTMNLYVTTIDKIGNNVKFNNKYLINTIFILISMIVLLVYIIRINM